jgi:hypothetical protein
MKKLRISDKSFEILTTCQRNTSNTYEWENSSCFHTARGPAPSHVHQRMWTVSRARACVEPDTSAQTVRYSARTHGHPEFLKPEHELRRSSLDASLLLQETWDGWTDSTCKKILKKKFCSFETTVYYTLLTSRTSFINITFSLTFYNLMVSVCSIYFSSL